MQKITKNLYLMTTVPRLKFSHHSFKCNPPPPIINGMVIESDSILKISLSKYDAMAFETFLKSIVNVCVES